MKATLGVEAIGGIPQYFPKTGIEIIDTTFDRGRDCRNNPIKKEDEE